MGLDAVGLAFCPLCFSESVGSVRLLVFLFLVIILVVFSRLAIFIIIFILRTLLVTRPRSEGIIIALRLERLPADLGTGILLAESDRLRFAQFSFAARKSETTPQRIEEKKDRKTHPTTS